MATDLPTDSREEQDSRYNPGELHAAEKFGTPHASAGLDQLESFANDPANATDAVKKQEETLGQPVNNGFYRPSPHSKQQKITLKSFFKKKGPLAAIIAILLGGGAGFSIMFAPALGIIHLKEVLFEDLNDQLAAVDTRSMHVIKSKLKTIQVGASVCTDNIQIRCKFSTFGKKQAAAFRSAKFEIESEPKALGREAVTKMTFTDPDTREVIVIDNPNTLVQQAKTNKNLRAALLRAYNPKFYTLKDAVATRFTGGKHARLIGTTTEAFDESVEKSVDESSSRYGTVDRVERGNVIDEEGNETKSTDEIGKQGNVSSVFSNAAKGIGVVGAADTACTVKGTSKMVQASAKALRAAELAGFAMVILNFADSVKAGDATWEQAEYVGNKVAATDTNKTVVNETSPLVTSGGIATPQKVDNPYYGMSGFDSPGIKTALYNDAPVLTARDQQFTVGGGGLIGTLAGVNAQIDEVLEPVGGESACKFVQNPIVRVASGAVGIVLGVFSGGSTLLLSVGASTAIALALPLLEAYLADIVAGDSVGADTKGVDAGNALFAGTGVIFGDIAKARGMKPATLDDMQTYTAATNKVKQDYIAYETEQAKSTPFDIMNQYSFLGSFARTLTPTIVTSSTSIASTVTTMPSLFSTAINSVISPANAVGTFNPERFQKCDDPAYEEMGIDADVFCNVRYVMSEREMNMETETAVEYMLTNEYITHEGEAKGAYAEWKKECVDRVNGWGEQENEEGNLMTGEACMADEYSGADTAYFRVFTMDQTLSDGMDDEEPVSETSPTRPSGENSGEVSPDGWAFPTTAGTPLQQGFHTGHKALDIAGAPRNNVPIYAVRDGEVMSAGTIQEPLRQPCQGNEGSVQQVVVIRHTIDGKVYHSTYHHLEAGSFTVRAGDMIKAGDRIASMGNTGCSFGQHLHIDVWQGELVVGIQINPEPLFY